MKDKNLPDMNSDVENAEFLAALKDVLAQALAPTMREIEKTVAEVRKQNPNESETAFILRSVTYSMDRIKEAVEALAADDKDALSKDELLAAITGFDEKSSKEQKAILSRMLANSDFQSKVLDGLYESMRDDAAADVKELLAVARESGLTEKQLLDETKRREEQRLNGVRQSRADRVKSEPDRDSAEDLASLLKKLLGFGSGGGFLGEVAMVARQGATLLGAFGMLKLLPEEVTKFVGDFTATFTLIREAFKASWLAPVLKIIEGVPLLGTIVKKLPLLNVIMASWEVLPKMVEEWRKKDWLAGIETGITELYKFFVGDVIEIVGDLIDKLQNRLFGRVVFSVGEFVRDAYEQFKKETAEKIQVLRDAIATGDIASLFKFEIREGSIADHVAKLISRVASFFSDVYNDPRPVTQQLSDAVTGLKDGVVGWLEEVGESATKWVAEQRQKLRDWVVSTAKDARATVVDAKAFVENLTTELWESAKAAIMGALERAYESMVDLKDDMVAWINEIVEGLKNYILDQLPFGVGDYLRDEKPEVQGDARKALDNERETMIKASEAQAAMRKISSMLPSAPVTVNRVDRSVRSHVSNFISGRPRGGDVGPLGASLGGR